MAERRYYRLEDWKGNVYYQDSSGSDSAASIHKDASLKDETGSGMTSDGTVVSDNTANLGKAVMLASNASSVRNLLTATFDNIPFGKYSISLRMKSNVATGTSNIIRVRCYYVDNTGANSTTLLSTTYITGETFGIANKYLDLGFITDFRGNYTSAVSLRVNIHLMNIAGTTAYMDTITIQRAMVGMAGLNTSYSV